MILSVVIVSYNVKFFLEQCLSSLKKAVEGISLPGGQTEVFIVDNASSDGSPDFLIPLFPGFQFIRNNENAGFAKANNQALVQCTGEFVLFLNPDTILPEDCLDTCLKFFRSAPDAGALGVHMISGAGSFLRESKRGFPTAPASFYKMTGFARLFPRSRIFAAYYMGHLHERIPHAVEVLSGAFMMVRKSILEKTGGFDEQFFMYGEDIDLSYRISQTGCRNYYVPGTTIIHFKGESTPKDLRHIKMFYAAMDLFMKKHFKGSRSSLQNFLLKLGVRLHRSLAYIGLPFKRSHRGKEALLRVFVKGVAESRQVLKSKLIEKNIPVTENENDAEEIIYCEGPLQSWKSIIAEVSKNKNRVRCKFHGAGTHAAVSSSSSREQGGVMEI
ncbi:MAG TPA: glycosyl transferase family 2 [Chitinophagaceae bacterium]|jgi:N-acetylglucosaminyl-diphospho-decaprenol L-rhamnosyltransferase|nr:glycosyl transferase family 2 [Chitinophagaceae bacterium]